MLKSERQLELEEIEKKQVLNLGFSAFNPTPTLVALGYSDEGYPLGRINPDVFMKDIAGYWRIHERKLWIITAICLLYLTMKLIGS